MPYVAKEAEFMLNNLLIYLKYKYRDRVLEYFTDTAKKEAREDRWDEKNKRIVCTTDLYNKKEIEDILGFEEAKLFINEQKKKMEVLKQASVTRLVLNEEEIDRSSLWWKHLPHSIQPGKSETSLPQNEVQLYS